MKIIKSPGTGIQSEAKCMTENMQHSLTSARSPGILPPNLATLFPNRPAASDPKHKVPLATAKLLGHKGPVNEYSDMLPCVFSKKFDRVLIQNGLLTLISSHLISSHLSSSHLISAHLIWSQLSSSHLSAAHLISAHLISAQLISSQCSSSHLTSSHLSSSHLISSHLSSSHLISAQLSSSHLSAAHLISSFFPPHLFGRMKVHWYKAVLSFRTLTYACKLISSTVFSIAFSRMLYFQSLELQM